MTLVIFEFFYYKIFMQLIRTTFLTVADIYESYNYLLKSIKSYYEKQCYLNINLLCYVSE